MSITGWFGQCDAVTIITSFLLPWCTDVLDRRRAEGETRAANRRKCSLRQSTMRTTRFLPVPRESVRVLRWLGLATIFALVLEADCVRAQPSPADSAPAGDVAMPSPGAAQEPAHTAPPAPPASAGAAIESPEKHFPLAQLAETPPVPTPSPVVLGGKPTQPDRVGVPLEWRWARFGVGDWIVTGVGGGLTLAAAM